MPSARAAWDPPALKSNVPSYDSMSPDGAAALSSGPTRSSKGCSTTKSGNGGIRSVFAWASRGEGALGGAGGAGGARGGAGGEGGAEGPPRARSTRGPGGGGGGGGPGGWADGS